jgi:hypothetical protein
LSEIQIKMDEMRERISTYEDKFDTLECDKVLGSKDAAQ